MYYLVRIIEAAPVWRKQSKLLRASYERTWFTGNPSRHGNDDCTDGGHEAEIAIAFCGERFDCHATQFPKQAPLKVAHSGRRLPGLEVMDEPRKY